MRPPGREHGCSQVTVATVPHPRATPTSASPSALDEEREVYEALTLGVRDYVDKNGFESVVLGLSGGIDSALVALLATDACGPERVRCVVMPSPHSSVETQSDARAIAANLGVELDRAPDRRPMEAYDVPSPSRFAGTDRAWPRRTCRPASAARC